MIKPNSIEQTLKESVTWQQVHHVSSDNNDRESPDTGKGQKGQKGQNTHQHTQDVTVNLWKVKIKKRKQQLGHHGIMNTVTDWTGEVIDHRQRR